MERDRSQEYRLVNLSDRPDVIEQITETEQRLNRMIDGDVALIAYVRQE